MKPMLEFVKDVCLHQIRRRQFFVVENPRPSRTWYQDDIGEILNQESVTWGDLDMCMHGLVDAVSKLPYKKGG